MMSGLSGSELPTLGPPEFTRWEERKRRRPSSVAGRTSIENGGASWPGEGRGEAPADARGDDGSPPARDLCFPAPPGRHVCGMKSCGDQGQDGGKPMNTV